MATFIVANTNDSGAGSLRQALLDANGAAGADRIEFQAGLAGQIGVASMMEILGATTVVGPGADKLTLRATGAGYRLLQIFDGDALVNSDVSISGLTLTNANLVGAGGAIFSRENLTLDGVAITNSNATVLGGAVSSDTGALAISNSSFVGNTSGQGGAIATTSVTTISNSTFSGNSAATAGAIYASGATMTISSSTFVGNAATAGSGGAALIEGAGSVIVNSIFANNTATAQGPDIAGGAATPTVSYSLVRSGTDVNVVFGAGAITDKAAAAYTPGAPTLAGGLTVYVPTAGSLVVNTGDPAYAGPPNLDARGLARVSGGRIDMGAAELQAIVALPDGGGAVQPVPPPTVAPTVNLNFNSVFRYQTFSTAPVAQTVTTPTGQVLPNPLLEQQKAIRALIVEADAGRMSLRQVQDRIVDLVDGTTSVATLTYQFFTGKLPSRDGLDHLVSSPLNPTDLNDGFYAGMSLENRYINFAVNLGKVGEGRIAFAANYGALSLTDATAKAYAEIFGKAADAAKVAAILTPERASYLHSLGGDTLGQKAAVVGWLLGEAAKTDAGPYAARNENFLYDLLDGTAAFGADAHIYDNAGPMTVGLIGVVEGG